MGKLGGKMEEKTYLEKKIMEMHPQEGRLRDDGGSKSVGTIVLDDKKEVAAYLLEHGNWNPYGGIRNSGITKWQGINIFDGENDIQVKPMAMWRDGENQYNDNPASHYSIEELKKVYEGRYNLVLENGNGIVEIHQIDFSKKESKLLESLKGSEYLERKRDKSKRI